MTQRLLVGAALCVAVLLTWLAWDGWLYLQSGYSLSVGMAGETGSIFHIDFPAWRTVIHVLIWVAGLASIAAYIAGIRWASTLAWLTLAVALAIGLSDVSQYGTMGSPTSIWTILLLLIFGLLTRFGRMAPEI